MSIFIIVVLGTAWTHFYNPAIFASFSEATQCVTLYSRQGTADTIEEVEDEQDQGEDKQEGAWQSQQLDEGETSEGYLWSDEPGEKGQEEGESREGLEGEEETDEPKDKDGQEMKEAPWESFGPDEGPSLRFEEAESPSCAQEKDFTTESEDGAGQQDLLQVGGGATLLYTPDTDASKTSDAEVPPSYSKAVSFDRLEVSDDSDTEGRKRRMTSDSRSDSRSDIMLPSMTTELTASELLLNK